MPKDTSRHLFRLAKANQRYQRPSQRNRIFPPTSVSRAPGCGCLLPSGSIQAQRHRKEEAGTKYIIDRVYDFHLADHYTTSPLPCQAKSYQTRESKRGPTIRRSEPTADMLRRSHAAQGIRRLKTLGINMYRRTWEPQGGAIGKTD